MAGGSIKLGGRLFTLVNYAAITSLNEHYVMKLMRETGLDKVLPEDDGLPSHKELDAIIVAKSATPEQQDRYRRIHGEAGAVLLEWGRASKLSADEARALLEQKREADTLFFARLHNAVIDSLRLHELLAGYLLPVGKTEADWSLEMAAETAAFLKGLQAQEDRDEINRLGSVVTLDFFAAGVASLKRSEHSLSLLAEATPPTPPETAPAVH